VKALKKLSKRAASDRLQGAFERHRAETQAQLAELEDVFELLDEKARAGHCEAMAGIIGEGKTLMGEKFDQATMDACLVAVGQRAEHYEMAAYGTLIAWARTLDLPNVVDALQQNLDEERATARQLSSLADGGPLESADTPVAVVDGAETAGAARPVPRRQKRR
jgi:ferritin-like metal-binding protein YciE